MQVLGELLYISYIWVHTEICFFMSLVIATKKSQENICYLCPTESVLKQNLSSPIFHSEKKNI